MTNRKYFIVIIILALLGLLYALVTVVFLSEKSPLTESIYPIAKSPYSEAVSAIGVVEASSENILIGTPLVLIVENVAVKVGDSVKTGDVLLTLTDPVLETEKNLKEIAYKRALSELEKLKAIPRPEDVVPLEAQVKSAEAEFQIAKYQLEVAKNLTDQRSISQEEMNRRQFTFQQMDAKLAQAKAELEKIKAGAWKPDIEISEINAQQALADLKLTDARIYKTIIRAPIDAVVLQVNIHKGEVTPPDSFKDPLIVLGNIDEYYLRTEIDQFNIPYFQPGQPAVAFLQGNANIKVDLQFVRVDPYLTSKQNISDDITAKVDTKILPVIYRFKRGNWPIYVGQQMDVFMQTDLFPKSPEASSR